MKKLTILFVILSINYLQSQNQKEFDYTDFDTSDLKTDLFITQRSPFSILDKKIKEYGMYNFTQTYKELHNNDTKNRFNELAKIQQISQPINYSHIVKVGLIHVEHESINEKFTTNGKLQLNGNKVIRNTKDYIFNKNTTTVIAPLCLTHKGLATTFILEKKFFVNNTNTKITNIKADFNDGNGFQNFNFNTPTSIHYTEPGIKKLIFKIQLENGKLITRKSSIKIAYSKADRYTQRAMMSTEVTASIVAPLATDYIGATDFAGLAEYEIFKGSDNNIDKPIFVIDGFDPGDTRDIDAVYNLLSYDENGNTLNLGDRIRTDENYDVVIINFPQYFKLSNGGLQSISNSTDVNNDGIIDTADYPGSSLIDGGADFIERNAMTVIKIIQDVNLQNSSTEQNVIIGPSMGGLISRYALSYMEQNSLSHHTRLWISFDSPHRGANVPIGFQQVFNFLAYGLGGNSVDSIKPIVDNLLKSPAARQMLVDHFESHLLNGDPDNFNPAIVLPTPHSYHIPFFNKIEALIPTTNGFPEITRNVAIINGSGNRTPYLHKDGSDVLPENKILDVYLTQTWPNPDLDLDVWCTPYTNNQITIGDQYIDMPWPISNEYCYAESKAPSYTNGVDAAMGGLFDIQAIENVFNDGTDSTISAFFNGLSIGGFNFIPSVSALAINDTNLNWFENINLGTPDTPWDGTTTSTSSQTPFVNWFMPNDNENHVTLTTANVNFTWLEIIEPQLLSVDDITISENTIQLINNPVNHQINLKSNLKETITLQILLFDINGKKILDINQKSNPYFTINTNVASGLYLLNIKDHNNNSLLNKKISIIN